MYVLITYVGMDSQFGVGTKGRPMSDRREHVGCRHCGRTRTGNRPRGLCWTCYYTPTVRSQYPVDPKRVPSNDGYSNSEQPPEPSKLRPRSAEKIAYLRERAEQGLGLFHSSERRSYMEGFWD